MPEPPIEDRPIEPDGGEPAPPASPADRLVIWGVSAAVIAAFLVVDYLTPYVMKPVENWRAFVLIGICVGQVNLIAAWAVLAPGNLVVRLPWAILLAMAMWYALMLGGRAAHFITTQDAILVGVILLGGAVIAQIPLWISKRVFRWHLVVGADDPVQAQQGPWQFTLQHLLLAMLLWSVALAPLRQVLPPGPIGHFFPDRNLLVTLGAAVVCNVLVTVPCIWGALYLKTALVRIATGWLLYCVILTFIELLVLSAILWPPGILAEEYAHFLIANVGQCAAVFGTLLIYRALGFRLVRAR
jgi:hypothetical protein